MDIAGVDIYRNDVRVRYRGKKKAVPPAKRKDVVEFSYKSRKKLAFVASNTAVVFGYMTTLTYPRTYSRDGREIKSNLNVFLNHLRRKNGGNYLWFMEFQTRGAPHFHVLHERPFMSCGQTSWYWFKIVDSGDWRHFQAGTRVERLRSAQGGSRYAVKYAMKAYQKAVPVEYANCGRFWGHSKEVKPEPLMRTDIETTQGVGDIIGDHEKARELIGRGVSVIYNASPNIQVDNS